MRRPVAAVVVAIAVITVLALTGCGGSPSPSKSSGTSSGSSAPPPAASSSASSGTPALSAKAITTPRPFPDTTGVPTPKAVLDALAAKHAFVLVFEDSRQAVTSDQKTALDTVMKKFRGLTEFVTFDLATVYSTADGTAAHKEAVQAADLAQKLDAGYAPVIVIVDKNGQITWQSSGYYDEGTLEREILRATQ